MLLNDLERNGLLEKKRQGLGKPNLLYVKNFNQKVEVKKSIYNSEKRRNKGNVEYFQKCKNMHLKK